MGLIPIICFTLAFIFLWAIVNHASLKRLQSNISDTQTALLENINDQNAVIKSVLESKENSVNVDKANPDDIASILVPQVSMLNKSVLVASIKSHQQKVNRLKAGNPGLFNQHPELDQQMSRVNNGLNNLTDTIFSYNNLVEKAPTKFLARMLGFNIIR